MKIKYQTKEYTIGIKDLDPPTLASLKKHIKKTISGLKDIEMNRLSLFLNKKKILASDDKELDSQDLQITDESTIFLIVTQSFSESVENNNATEKAKSTADIPQQQHQSPNGFGFQPNDSQFMQNMMNNPNMYNAMNSPNMYGFMNNQHGMGVPSGLEKQLIEQIINNPDSILQMIESQMPNMPEEQKAFLKSNIELMKKNPEMIRQIYSQINNPMMGNPMMQSPMMQNNPMMNNHMMQNNPAMQSPMMGNPAMQNAYFMAPPPPDGPCFHGYYPLKNVDGVLRQRDPKEVYASKIELLKDMGFPDEETNLSVLVETKGNMDAAVVKLTKKMEKEE